MSATASKGNLVLLRRPGETVIIGEGRNRVELTVEKVDHNKIVTLKFKALKSLKIDRLERAQ